MRLFHDFFRKLEANFKTILGFLNIILEIKNIPVSALAGEAKISHPGGRKNIFFRPLMCSCSFVRRPTQSRKLNTKLGMFSKLSCHGVSHFTLLIFFNKKNYFSTGFLFAFVQRKCKRMDNKVFVLATKHFLVLSVVVTVCCV